MIVLGDNQQNDHLTGGSVIDSPTSNASDKEEKDENEDRTKLEYSSSTSCTIRLPTQTNKEEEVTVPLSPVHQDDEQLNISTNSGNDSIFSLNDLFLEKRNPFTEEVLSNDDVMVSRHDENEQQDHGIASPSENVEDSIEEWVSELMDDAPIRSN
jgi:hypothetical protein